MTATPFNNHGSPPQQADNRVAALEQELASLREQQDQLLYTVSHDLRTPVMTILGFADMLTTDLSDSPQDALKRQYLEHIRSSAVRQSDMITGLLRLTATMRQPLHPELLNLTQLCAEIWQARPDTATITVKFQPTPSVLADRETLLVLLKELLDNAVKFAAAQRTLHITVGTATEATTTYFYIRHNGEGFDMERAKRLGQPFKRLHTKQYPGVGIGIALCMGIVQRHHGRMWFDSQLGEGTTVYFTLGQQPLALLPTATQLR